MIGDDDIGTGPFHGQERFQDDTLFVDPAVPGGGFYHGVFAADVVDGNGAVDAVPGLTDDIEVGHGRLDHDDVGTFVEVEADFLHGFPGIGRIHLILAAVTELRGRIGGIAEGTVKSRGVFDGVGHDGYVLEAVFVEGRADGGDTAVHHIRRGDDIGAGLCLADGRPGQKGQGRVVIDVMAAEFAAMAVAGVLAKTDIADDDQTGQFLLDGFHGPLYRALWVPGRRARFILVFRQTEDFDGRDSEGCGKARRFYGFIDRQVVTAGQAGDFFPYLAAGNDEDRINQVRYGQVVFPYHGADRGRNAQTART